MNGTSQLECVVVVVVGCAVARWCPRVAPPCCGAPGWRLRARALTGAAVVVLSGKLRLVVVVLVVMLVTP